MAFQRSYSKVWWGSEQQLSNHSNTIGSSFTSGGYYSYFNHTTQHQHQQQQQQQTQYHQEHQQQQQQYQQHNNGYHSLDLNNFRTYNGNLSRIQEVDDEQNISRLSAASAVWEKHDSPGSLRSQDSGFSDNDESHSMRSLGGRSSKTASPSTRSVRSTQSAESPASANGEAVTPPTVIRRVRKPEFYSPLVSVSRRISFAGPSVSRLEDDDNNNNNNNNSNVEQDVSLQSQLDELSLLNASGAASQLESGETESSLTKPKRRRRVTRRPTKPLTPTKRRTAYFDGDNSGAEDEQLLTDELTLSNGGGGGDELDRRTPTYNNETIMLGGSPPPPYNNETVLLDGFGGNGGINDESNSGLMSPLRGTHYTAQTSTPKRQQQQQSQQPQPHHHNHQSQLPPPSENPLLNGHPAALQAWLGDLRMSYEHEVMSTLQTKSIAQQAIQNLTITTNTVTKLIRQLQQRAICLQAEFERIERLLMGNGNNNNNNGVSVGAALQLALDSTEQLLENVDEFTLVLQRRAVFFADSRADRRRYDDCLEEIRIIAKDTRYSLERQHYISPESLLDDVQVMKRHLLIALRQVFERMVHVIVQRIESGHCDLMLRANINMIATLSNIDYEGFASLTDAFVQCETVRALLIVCLEHRSSTVRAQALRALATVCCAPEAIAQLGACGGIEILRDILQVPTATPAATPSAGSMRRRKALETGATERREAVSLLTQITAAWHGPDHRVDGLRDCIETIVEGLTQMIVQTRCAQTLLLCAAALNNLSRIEVTSHYSIMSNEAIFRLVETAEQKEEEISIFFYEQVVAMLHNMSLNKKCHSHLANGSIINFITSAYQAQFYRIYESRAESESQRRTVKAILHTLTRLVHDSNLGVDLLAQQRGVPAFLRLTNGGSGGAGGGGTADLSQLHAEISLLARDLLYAQRGDERRTLHGNNNSNISNDSNVSELGVDCGTADGGDLLSITSASGLKLNLARQESYV